MDYRRHILVTGPHRSGTTWIGKTISNHDKVHYIHEPFNVDFEGYNFHHRFKYWFEHVPTSKEKGKVERVFDKYIPTNAVRYATKICRESGYSLKTPLLFIKYLLLSSNMPFYLLKDPIALLSAGWLYERYHLQVICVTRNPLAFASSLKKLNWDFNFDNFLKQEELMETHLSFFKEEMVSIKQNGDFIDRVALLWNVLNYTILEYRKKYPDWLFTTHEKLALNPIEGFQEIFSYLELEFDEKIISYIREFTSSKNPEEVSTHEFQARDSEKSIYTWKKHLTENEVDRLTSATEEIYNEIYNTRLFLK